MQEAGEVQGGRRRVQEGKGGAGSKEEDSRRERVQGGRGCRKGGDGEGEGAEGSFPFQSLALGYQ